MKPPEYWRDKLCNRFVLNTKDNTEVIRFIEAVQRDARGEIEDERIKTI